MTMKLTYRVLQWASLLLLLGSAALAQNTEAFQQAERRGEDMPGSTLRWTFRWDGKEVEIGSDGKGTVGGESLQIPLNSTRLTAKLQYATYDGDLLLLVEETDESSAAGKIARFDRKTLKPKWTCDIPNSNVGPALIEGKFVYLTARYTAMKVNLESGNWDWRKTNLNRINEGTALRFQSFGLPIVNKETVTFPEVDTGEANPRSIILNKADGELVELRGLQSADPKNGNQMYYVVETAKSFEQAARDLETAVKKHGYGVLHIHDLGKTLRSKNIAFAEECRIFEVCNPEQAAKVLTADMRLNMALPCRISVYTEGGQTKIGFIKPGKMLSALSKDASMLQVASEVERATTSMVNEAANP